MKDHVASRAMFLAQLGDPVAVEMLSIHLDHWEFRILTTERNLEHALACHDPQCWKCLNLSKDLKRRQGTL